jgi:hypothetical protein
VNGVTEEMIAKAALALRDLPNLRGHSVAEVTRFAAVALDVGLAGCAAVDLPAQDGEVWRVGSAEVVAQPPNDGDRTVVLRETKRRWHIGISAADARGIAGALLAGADEADRMAAAVASLAHVPDLAAAIPSCLVREGDHRCDKPEEHRSGTHRCACGHGWPVVTATSGGAR